ncbi:MAG: maltose ABC transporter substrate-binding protein [Propionibacteriaceae bacterium]|jgi:arabinogalactan oligomer/maltooligosaccharide transport system substrate-binding protein|nr:maltose ABC transporter substrate-binding protein [Propionibacteriaceae bacterium]
MKKLITVAGGILLALSLAACGGSPGNGSAQPPTDQPAEPVELVVWESLEGPDEFIKQAGAKYTESHPNVTIKFVNVELGDSSTQIALDGPAGKGPDLFAAPHDRLGELVSGGHILPTANSAGLSVQESAVKALTYDGTMYGYPVSSETYSLFYNKAMVQDPPKTWDEVITFAKDFNAKNKGKYGFVMDVGNGYYTILFTTSNDNRLFGPDGTDTTNTNINSPASVEGMKQFVKLREALEIPAADLGTDAVDALFAGGKAAMHITGPWNIKPFTDAGIDFGVATLPALTGNTEPAASFSGTRGMFASAYSEHPEQAAEFAAFLTTAEMQKLRYDITGALPVADVAVDSAAAQGLIEQLQYAFPMPSIPQMSAFWDAMNNASANVWNGADIQKELDAANKTILAS